MVKRRANARWIVAVLVWLTAGVSGFLPSLAPLPVERLAAAAADRIPSPAPAQSGDTDRDASARRLGELLDGSGLEHDRIGEAVWETTFRGDNTPVIVVVVSLYGDLVVAQSVVAEEPQLAHDQALQILRWNFDTDLAKASLTSDGSLTVLNEAELRLLDGDGLRTIVDAVAALADGLVAIVGPAAVGPVPEMAMPLEGPPARPGDQTLSLLRQHAGVRYDGAAWTRQLVDGNDGLPARLR